MVLVLTNNMNNKNKETNDNSEKPSVSIDDVPAEVIAALNSIVTQTEPIDFLKEFHDISRENAFVILELTHRGRLAPSYQCYGYLTLVVLAGSPENAMAMYSSGVNWIKSNIPNA